MALILTRSPFFVYKAPSYDSGLLKLEIGTFNCGDGFSVEKTFNLDFRNATRIDISPLINDYIAVDGLVDGTSYFTELSNSVSIKYVKTTLSRTLSGVPQADVINTYLATAGYLYSVDSYNKDFSSDLVDNCYYAGSSDIIYKLDDSNVRIPLLSAENNLSANTCAGGIGVTKVVYVYYMKDGEIIETDTIVFNNENNWEQFVIASSFDTSSYRDRVEGEGGIVESTFCSNKFFRDKVLNDVDNIRLVLDGNIKDIEVVTVSECKYKPYRVTFANRFGVPEDLWFFKRSSTSMTTQKETYRSNSITRYTSSQPVKTFSDFNVNARERLLVNSGWVDERLNESFKQLMLSQEIVIYDYNENKTYQVNIATSDLRFKDHVTDKVINYEIEFEIAHEVINNVG